MGTELPLQLRRAQIRQVRSIGWLSPAPLLAQVVREAVSQPSRDGRLFDRAGTWKIQVPITSLWLRVGAMIRRSCSLGRLIFWVAAASRLWTVAGSLSRGLEGAPCCFACLEWVALPRTQRNGAYYCLTCLGLAVLRGLRPPERPTRRRGKVGACVVGPSCRARPRPRPHPRSPPRTGWLLFAARLSLCLAWQKPASCGSICAANA